jgi:hypothetical protein
MVVMNAEWTDAMFALFFVFVRCWLAHLYTDNIKSKQSEVDRLTDDYKATRKENEEMRGEIRKLYEEQNYSHRSNQHE